MKIIIAPDSFKGCLRSPEVCEYLKTGILQGNPGAEVICIPMADGGEGTVDAAVASTSGAIRKVEVHDPLARKVMAEYGILGNSGTAVMEMASANGLELLKPEELNPWITTTYGTGEVIRDILRQGIRDIIIGIGGSATSDGGAGMAQALGYKLLDKNGESLVCGCSGGGAGDLASIDSSNVMSELKNAKIRVACDVTNPLLGPDGAAEVYSPQKGADPEMVKKLEANLTKYSKAVIASGLTDNCEHPGDGAAGGLGFGLRAFCSAEMVSGAELMVEITGLKDKLPGVSMLITGEGCTDAQTGSGKLCAVIAETAHQYKVPAVLVSGALKGNGIEFLNIFNAAFSIASGPGSLENAMKATPDNLVLMGRNLANLSRGMNG